MEIPDDPIAKAFRWLCEFTGAYNGVPGGPKSSNDAACVEAKDRLRLIAEWIDRSIKISSATNFTVDYSRGAGLFPRIPWICVLPPGEKTSDGCYVSVCFGKNGNGAVSGFAESTTNRVGLKVVARSNDPQWVIDVDGPKPNTKYNDGYVNPKEFLVDSFRPDELLDHIVKSLALYSEFRRSVKVVANNSILHVNLHGFGRFGEAVVCKGFAILTGNSGTGKTRLAEDIATTFRNHNEVGAATNLALVPVGADWTDNRAVVGFVNHLRQARQKDSTTEQPVYQTTTVLDLLLEAEMNPSWPHFLILDEMNLLCAA